MKLCECSAPLAPGLDACAECVDFEVAEGLRPVPPGTLAIPYHGHSNDYQRARRRYWRARGRCGTCCKRPRARGGRQCTECVVACQERRKAA